VPLGADGKPLPKEAMFGANFDAVLAGKPEPYTDAQINAAKNLTPSNKSIADEFAAIFDRR